MAMAPCIFKDKPVPTFAIFKPVIALFAPVIAKFITEPVLAESFPEDDKFSKLPVSPVEDEEIFTPDPDVNALSVTEKALPVAAVEDKDAPAVPVCRAIAVAPVVFPIVIVFALLLFPILIAPVVPESKVNELEVFEFIVRFPSESIIPPDTKVNVASGEVVPIPKRAFELSQKRLALFCETTPEAPANNKEPWVASAKASVFPVATVVFPFKLTAPVPVLNVPDEAEKSKLLAPPLAVKVLPDAKVVFPFKPTAPVPVSNVPVPDMAKFPED